MRPPAADRPGLGLRARLVCAFALLCVVTAAAVAGGIYVLARNAVLQRTQDAAVEAMTSRVRTLFPLTTAAPGAAELDRLAEAVRDVNGDALAVYRQDRSPAGPELGRIPAELRRAVAGGHVAWQRVVLQGRPVLLVGVPLLIVEEDGTPRVSGIELYTARSLIPEQRSIDALAASARLTGAVALAFAVALALLATRGVLGPVRELGRAARLLGEGELRTRVAVRGSDELADLARTFNSTAGRLERQVEQLRAMEADARRFVADVSHELRTPLAALVAVADVLDEEAPRLPEPAGRAARLVSQETLHLSALVNDLIEISRFDSGVAALAPDDVDVAELVAATLRARGWSEQVRTDLEPAVAARLDPRRVDVVLANLVGNALRHGEPPVTVRLRADPHRIVLEVRDHGPGLDAAVLPHVFDRFYKAGAARARSEGSGLGLAIARENARLHGGDVTVVNAPDGGALFTLHLPRRLPDPDVPEPDGGPA